MKNFKTITMSLFIALNIICHSLIAAENKPNNPTISTEKKAEYLEIPEALKPFFAKYHEEPCEKNQVERRLATLLTLLYVDSSVDLDEKLAAKLDNDKTELATITAQFPWFGQTDEQKRIASLRDKYLEHQTKLREMIKLHQPYLRGKKIVNFYKNMPENMELISDWVKNDIFGQDNVPFKKYKTIALEHLKFIDTFLIEKDKYPELVEKLEQTRGRITNSLRAMNTNLQDENRQEEEKERQKREEEKERIEEERAQKAIELKRISEEKERQSAQEMNKRMIAAEEDKNKILKKQVDEEKVTLGKITKFLDQVSFINLDSLVRQTEEKIKEFEANIEDLQCKIQESNLKVPELERKLQKMKSIAQCAKNFQKSQKSAETLSKKLEKTRKDIKDSTEKINLEMNNQLLVKYNVAFAKQAKQDYETLIQKAKKEESEFSTLRKELETVYEDLVKVVNKWAQEEDK